MFHPLVLNSFFSAVKVQLTSSSFLLYSGILKFGPQQTPVQCSFRTENYQFLTPNYGASKTLVKTGTSVVSSSSQRSTGSLVQDTLMLAGGSANSSSISNVTFVLTNDSSTTAVVGLAFTPGQAWGNFSQTLVDQIKAKSVFSANNVISYFIPPSSLDVASGNSSLVGGGGPSIDFGGIDPSLFVGNISWQALTPIPLSGSSSSSSSSPSAINYLWSLPVTSFMGTAQASGSVFAILATGSAMITLPSQLLNTVVSQTATTLNTTTGQYEIDCAQYSKMPNVSLTFSSSITISLSPTMYLFRKLENSSVCFTSFVSAGGSGGNSFNNSNAQTIVLGNAFLR